MDQNNAIEIRPDEIAAVIFSSPPKPAHSYCLCEDGDQLSVMYIYEVLNTIFFEGVVRVAKATDVSLGSIEIDHLNTLQPWIESLGFIPKIETVTEKPTDHYATAMLRTGEHAAFFTEKKIEFDYHFTINGKYAFNPEPFTDLADAKTLLTVGSQHHLISFELIEPNGGHSNDADDVDDA